MHIQAYNLDSLRNIIRSLQDENRRLKDQLSRANIPCETSNIFIEKIEKIEEYDPDQGGRILDRYITKDLANQFFSFFWGRTDVYAKRGRKGGYFPQCNNRWNDRICPKQRKEKLSCEACEHREWTKLTPEKIIDHLVGYKEDGSDVLGVYPLFLMALADLLYLILIIMKKERSRRILLMLRKNGMRKLMHCD